jgi:DNA-binding protein HU-beta
MNKSELIDALSGRLGGKSAASTAVEHVVDTITRAVAKGEKVTITGFGVFEKADRAARTGRNPATGAVVKIKKTSVPKFRPGAEFKAYVAGTKKLAKAVPVAAPAAKKAATKTVAKKTAAKKTAKKVAKAPARKAPATKKAAAKTLAKKSASPAKKSAAAKKLAKAPARKTAAKKTTAKKTTARKAPAKKSAARKAPAKRGRR